MPRRGRIVDVTPAQCRCLPWSCPAVFDAGDAYLVIGRHPDPEAVRHIAHRIGPGETVVAVPKPLLDLLDRSRQKDAGEED
ncbi:MAG: hypothetical protein KatS3mg082_3383 [Nitrospiraceae bacterium]|nr:MAG: hypothetical protein KatS3mg082_3383 [Nitrospiraceae bacterium]